MQTVTLNFAPAPAAPALEVSAAPVPVRLARRSLRPLGNFLAHRWELVGILTLMGSSAAYAVHALLTVAQ